MVRQIYIALIFFSFFLFLNIQNVSASLISDDYTSDSMSIYQEVGDTGAYAWDSSFGNPSGSMTHNLTSWDLYYIYYNVTTLTNENYFIQTDIYWSSDSLQYGTGQLMKFVDSNNHIINFISQSAVSIYKTVGGSQSLVTTSGITLTAGWHNITTEVRGDSYSVYIDGTIELDGAIISDSIFNSTENPFYIGYVSGNGNSGYAHWFDNFLVDEIEVPYLSATFGYDGVLYSDISAGSVDESASGNVFGDYDVAIDTNTYYNIYASGTDFDDGAGHTFGIDNLKAQIKCDDYIFNIYEANVLSGDSQLMCSCDPIPTTNYHAYWLSVPENQYATSYVSTVTITYEMA
jgi:hypothetical protein